LLIQGGGPTATALVTLARLGAQVAFAGAVGGDDYGRRILAGLAAEGVDCRAVQIDPAGTSQVAFIAVDRQARRTVFCHRGSARPLAVDDLPLALIRQARLLLLDGLPEAAALAAARAARAAGVITLLDGGSLRAGSRDLLPLIDHAVVSRRFARQLTGSDDPRDALLGLRAAGAREAVVTLGADGALALAANGGLLQQPAFPVAALDTTGCGDVYHGAYAFALLHGWSQAERLRFAAAAAALKTLALGGRTGIPRRAAIDALLAAHPEIAPHSVRLP
jgi:ribokinase